VSQSTEIVNGDAGKRQIKKYGNNLNASSSPSRSRSATKELIRKSMSTIFNYEILFIFVF
jgi:hypothetical protein